MFGGPDDIPLVDSEHLLLLHHLPPDQGCCCPHHHQGIHLMLDLLPEKSWIQKLEQLKLLQNRNGKTKKEVINDGATSTGWSKSVHKDNSDSEL